MKTLVTIWILIATLAGLQAQSFSGRVVDAETKEGISDALIRDVSLKVWAQTDSAGYFSIPKTALMQNWVVTRLGYHSHAFSTVHVLSERYHIELKPATSLPTVEIVAGAQPVIEDRRLHWYDYAFYADGIMAILYDRVRNRPYLAWLDAADSVLAVADGPQHPGALFTDCQGMVHALTKDLACQLFIDSEKGILMYEDPIEDFRAYVEPCMANAGKYYFYKQARLNGQIMEIFRYEAGVVEPSLVLALKDKERIHQMLDPLGPYVQFASTEKGLASIPKEYWDKINAENHLYQFDRLAFFQDLFAPVHPVGPHVYIFDHLNGLLRKYSESGTPLDSVSIQYHKNPDWKKEILIDKVRGKAYTLFEKHGFVRIAEVDLKTGALGADISLPKQFPSRVQVRDGVVYFLYDPHEAFGEAKRLWRMSLS